MAKSKIEITADELKKVSQIVGQTYGVIAGDVPESDNEQAIECALDANYAESYCRDKALVAEVREITRKLFDKHGYVPVLKFLSKKIQVV